MGGGGDDEGRGVAIDSGGNVYTADYYHGTVDFDPNSGVTNLTSRSQSSLISCSEQIDRPVGPAGTGWVAHDFGVPKRIRVGIF